MKRAFGFAMESHKPEIDPSGADHMLIYAILQEIDAKLSGGVLPVHNGHLEHMCEAGELLERLVHMKNKGLISGDVVAKGADKIPFRMTNIRLTFLGIRALKWWLDDRARSS